MIFDGEIWRWIKISICTHRILASQPHIEVNIFVDQLARYHYRRDKSFRLVCDLACIIEPRGTLRLNISLANPLSNLVTVIHLNL
jgi:hypothetical protein